MAKLKSPFEQWLERPFNEHKGLHHEIFVGSCFLLDEGWSKEETFDLLRKTCNKVEDRYVPDREIWSAINYAWQRVTGELSPGPVWPRRDDKLRAEILGLFPVKDLLFRLPIPASAPVLTWLRMLYREEALLCIGKTAFEFRTVQLGDLLRAKADLSLCEFINPSPMSAVVGKTLEGNDSFHSRSNTGPRVYGVIEFDYGTVGEHIAILKCLATQLSLVMIVFSGSKSCHGWFNTLSVPEEKVLEFYKLAVSLGADPKMYSTCQFTRLPMGTNSSTGVTQQVLHFNLANVTL